MPHELYGIEVAPLVSGLTFRAALCGARALEIGHYRGMLRFNVFLPRCKPLMALGVGMGARPLAIAAPAPASRRCASAMHASRFRRPFKVALLW